MTRELDYPDIGVCSWRSWSQEAACYLLDPKRGIWFTDWRAYRRALRLVRQRPFGVNPWRRCFARYVMTPWEAKETLFGDDPDEEARWLKRAAEIDARFRRPRDDDGGGQVVHPRRPVLS